MSSGDLAIVLILSLIAHGWGDYVIQTDQMAVEKVKRWSPALWHAGTYGIAFLALVVYTAGFSLPLTVAAMAIICGTHVVIDRYRLARHVIWLKNRLLGGERASWQQCRETGFPPGRPEWLTKWLMIIVDNIIHITINTLVIICTARWGA